MDKSADAFRSIGEISKLIGVKTHILRYWEEQFPTLRPLTRAGGRRYYRAEDVTLVQTINRLLNQEGYTIKGARQYLARSGKADMAPVAAVSAATPMPAAVAMQTNTASGIDAFQLRKIRDRLHAALLAA
jgi:DNA-binding transcriptional MerR regulator